MRFNQTVDGARSLAGPFDSARSRARILCLDAVREVSRLTAKNGSQAELRGRGMYRTRVSSAWEDLAFVVLQVSGLAGIVLALVAVIL